MKEFKSLLIDSFNAIEHNIFNILANIQVINGLYTHDCTKLINEISFFSKKANLIIISTYIEHDVASKYFISTPESIAKIRDVLASLNSAIDVIVNSLELIKKGVTSSEFENLYMEICSSAGCISLSLRFELPAPPILDSPLANTNEINDKLEILKKINKDYFQLNHIYQHSIRRFLPSISMPDTAIILQGPIQYEDDFTLETLYRYRKIYPDTLIILSTWENEPTDLFLFLATSVNVLVIQSPMPQDKGAANIKCQLASTMAGLNTAKEFPNINYAIKTRSDQCIFLPDFLPFLQNMQKTFICTKTELSERLIFLGGWNSMFSFPFRVSDFLVFGALYDLEHYYSCSGYSPYLAQNYELENSINKHVRKWTSRVLFDNIDALYSMTSDERKSLNERNRNSFDPETYICCTFYENYILKRAFLDDDDRLDHYWNFLKEYAIVVNADQLMLFWHKYEYQKYNWNSLVCDGGLTNSLWLSLYYQSLKGD